MEEQEDTQQTAAQLDRVAAHWGRTAKSRRQSSVRGWLDSYPVVAERLNAPVSGSPHVNWLIGLARRLEIDPASRWLSVGCGTAGHEIEAAREGLFGQLDAVDLSNEALEEARGAAAAAGVDNISFRQVDFNRFEPSADTYDVVLMNMSLHHVKELDSLLARIATCLRPDGFFLINEYIGPRQFQFSDQQLEIVQELLTVLPDALRQDLSTGEIKTTYDRKPVEYWNVVDPSEAVRSDRIVPTVEHYFDVVERIDYGGTILHLLLEHIVHNFDHGDPNQLGILRLLGKFEDLLLSARVLTSDFTVMALRPKRTPAPAAAKATAGDEEPDEVDSELEFLRDELTKAYSYIWKIETSRGWRLLERFRRLFGRGWRKG
ncbi:MAG: class I SAM-dependent methyltransferase [Acidobacteriota bacterium]